jgi:putative membrane protein insertion efficiency factor
MTRTLDLLWQRFHQALVWVVLLPVAFYRRVLSPIKRAPTCRYLPTCSEYAVTAVRERGIVVGIALATWRILRCNPFARGGVDPVPHRCSDHHRAQEQH